MSSPFIGKNSASSTSCTLPEFLPNDTAYVFSFRAALTAPSLPAGWTNVSTQSANSNSFRVGSRVLVAGDTVTGTWTNADFVIVVVYRNISATGAAGSTTSAADTSTEMSGFTPQIATGSSWRLAWGGSVQTTSMSTPAGWTLRASHTAGASMGVLFDFNAGITSASQLTSTNGASAVSGGGSVELRREWQNRNQNYMGISVGDGMSVGEKIK